MQQAKINDFFRQYVDQAFKNQVNVIRLSRENTDKHNLMVCKICIELLKQGIPFYTEVRLKCGTRPDIVCPSYIKPIIEVLHSETIPDFALKKAPKMPVELRSQVIFVRSDEKNVRRAIS